ncbi:MAG: hypothetical protein AAGI03_16865 [Pseudomonadota bacterium]
MAQTVSKWQNGDCAANARESKLLRAFGPFGTIGTGSEEKDGNSLLSKAHSSLFKLLGSDVTNTGQRCVKNALKAIGDGTAARLLDAGWNALKVFGADPVAPWARYDNLGAAYSGGTVTHITADTLAILHHSGSRTTPRRKRGDSATVFPWLSNTQSHEAHHE